MLRFVSKGAIEPGPPTPSHEVGLIVEVIRSMRLSKSGCAAAETAGSGAAAARGLLAGQGRHMTAGGGAHLLAEQFGAAGHVAVFAVADDRQRRAGGRGTAHAAAHEADVGHALRVGSGQTHLGRGHEVRNRNDQIADGIRLRVDLHVAHLLAGDLQDFVLDHVAQVQRFEDQVQGALEHDLAGQIDGDRGVAGHAFFAQACRIEVQVDFRQLGEIGHDLA